jgi:hypothetical protein
MPGATRPASVRDNPEVSIDREALSFGDVAESYDRVRPGPGLGPAALDWLVPDGCTTAVDLAAGTGCSPGPCSAG